MAALEGIISLHRAGKEKLIERYTATIKIVVLIYLNWDWQVCETPQCMFQPFHGFDLEKSSSSVRNEGWILVDFAYQWLLFCQFFRRSFTGIDTDGWFYVTLHDGSLSRSCTLLFRKLGWAMEGRRKGNKMMERSAMWNLPARTSILTRWHSLLKVKKGGFEYFYSQANSTHMKEKHFQPLLFPVKLCRNSKINQQS